MERPRNQPKPPTIAASSPNCRSPDKGVKVAHEGRDKIAKMRPLRMPRDLRLLPGRQIGIKIGKRLFGLALRAGSVPRQWQRRRPFPRAGGVPEPWLRVLQPVFQNRDSFALPPESLCQGLPALAAPSNFRRGAKRTGNSRTVTNANALLPLALQARGNSPFCAAKSRYRAGRRARFGPRPALCRVRGGFAGQHRVKRADVACGAKFRRNLLGRGAGAPSAPALSNGRRQPSPVRLKDK